METFFISHAYLMEHFNAPVRRSLMDTIDWSYRMIGIKGPRGVGRTSFLLQYAKENFDPQLRQCLYINLNSFYFQAHGIVDFAGRFVEEGGSVLLIDQAFKLPDWREQLVECYHKYPYLRIVYTTTSVNTGEDSEDNSELSSLSRTYVLHGQIWRLITFLFQPIWLGSVLGILNLVFYFWIGNALTRVWGDFRMTLFIALGVVGAWVSCLLTGSAGPSAIFQSMLFAYTWLWPDQMVLLFGIIPFKMKYLGWYELALWAISFLMGDFATKLSLIFGLAGFLAFYGREVFDWCRDAITSWKRRRDWENRNR